MERYICNVCKYKTEKKSSIMNHIVSLKHKNNVENSRSNMQYIKMNNEYVCIKCLKVYKHYQSLSRHVSMNCVKKYKITNIDDLLKYLQPENVLDEENEEIEENVELTTMKEINDRIDKVIYRMRNISSELQIIEENRMQSGNNNNKRFIIGD